MAHHEKPEEIEEPGVKEEQGYHGAESDTVENKADIKEEVRPKGKHAASAKQKLRDFLDWHKTHKKIAIPACAVLFLIIFFSVPFTRYSALGLFLKQNFSVVVVDSQTGKPVSSALISLKGKTANTDGEGKASLRVPVGESKLVVTKTYYKTVSQEVVVPVKKPVSALNVKLEATGRPVPVTVFNNISGKPISGAVLSSEKSQAKTDEKGQATLVVPAGKIEVKGSLSADGYNKVDITVKVTTQEDEANKFKLTPSGKIYFLSNQSGKIDVVKSDLDGNNRQTVLAGTGKEAKGETVLLATRDWKYLALYSRRDGGEYAKLFLINTSDDSLVTMDEGEASFTLVGWEGHQFSYTVNRVKLADWEPKKQALKSYDADTKKLKTLDQTIAEGQQYDYKYEILGSVYSIEGKLLYTKYWYGSYYGYYPQNMASKQATLNSIKPDGGDKKVVKAFDTPNDISIKPYGADELYVQAAAKFYEYESGKLRDLPNMNSQTYYDSEYATYLLSPSGNKTFWSQVRDGRVNLLIGSADGKDEKKVATLDADYQTYGWFTDEFLLVSKKGSELFIMPAEGVEKEEQLFKITDYYKPYYNYAGYGGGYGGL